jgi:hypothetical protein
MAMAATPTAHELFVTPFKGPKYLAANRAVFNPLAPARQYKGKRKVVHQIKQIYVYLQSQTMEALLPNLIDTPFNRMCVRMARCVPAGGAIRRNSKDQNRRPPKLGLVAALEAAGAEKQNMMIRRTCGYDKYCPWCHYRRFVKLYDQVAGLGKCKVVLLQSHSISTDYAATHQQIMGPLNLRLMRTIRPVSAWVVSRPDLGRSKTAPVTRYDVLAVDPRPGKLEHEKSRDGFILDDLKYASSGQKAADKLLPLFYPYQKQLLIGLDALSNMQDVYSVRGAGECQLRWAVRPDVPAVACLGESDMEAAA